MSILIWLVVATLAMTVATVALMRAPPRWMAVGVNLLLIAQLVAVLRTGGGSPIALMKVFTVGVGANLFVLARATALAERSWFRRLLVFTLAGNIAVLGAREVVLDGMTMNAFAGIGLVLLLALPRTLRVSDDKQRRVTYQVTIGWVLAYAVWDYNFLSMLKDLDGTARVGSWGGLALVQVVATLLACRFRAEDFMVARVCSLVVLGIPILVVPFEPWLMFTPGWRTPGLAQALYALALALVLGAAVAAVLRARRGEAPQNGVEWAVAALTRRGDP
ncbi:MAG: hypothetical protein H6739_13160 [Alphaproteobacteria bacterium]|nr:hypothetical protein [Alphaproteobacteria bacterium]